MPLNTSRVRLEQFVTQAGQSLTPGQLALDAGAGSGVYRHLFDHVRYESADFMQVDKDYAPDITYVGDLAHIPVDDDRFDLVVLTQVLEHLPEPVDVLVELRRVLKPGRRIWASTPLYYEEHEQPYDFFRYTQFGLRRIFGRAGFSDVTIGWLEGYWMTIAYQLDQAARAAGQPFHRPLRWASHLAAHIDLRHQVTGRGHPKNYWIIAAA
jgi:SAM-dependent methyltransferase